jgi:hypothetical protein
MCGARLLPIRRSGLGVPYDSERFLISEKDKKITAGTNHMTTFSLQTLHGGWKKTFVNNAPQIYPPDFNT